MDNKTIATRIFGNTGQQVTSVGLGGEGILRTHRRIEHARDVILEATVQGITYFDSARVYDDSEVYYGSVWHEFPEMRSRIFQASKSASRDKEGASVDLDNTLQRLGTNYLDLWQIHDVRTDEDLEKISGSGGALEAFVGARSSGKVRFIGVTGHHDPHILTRALREWPIDAVMMPVNPVEGILGGFLTSTLPVAKEKGVAIIGMKVVGASHYILPEWDITPELLIRYALSHDIAVAIVGCSTVSEVRALADIGRDTKAFSEQERSHLLKVFEPHARRLAYYRGVI
jgi:aryl-alcohol dehydrogenase-like predicted oxidoreductase